MTTNKKKFNDVLMSLTKAGRLLWKGLSFSLADPVFSLAKVVCISMEADGIYLAYGERTFRRINIRSFKHYPLPENRMLSPEYVATSVSGFVKEFNISKATFILGLPCSWAIVQSVDFPLAAKENLEKVVAFELDRLTPLSRDNACYDYEVLDEDARHLKVLLAVVRAEKVGSYLDALKARNIEVKKVGLSVFMIRHLIKNTYRGANTVFLSLKKDGAYEGGAVVNDSVRRSFAGNIVMDDPDGFDVVAERISAMMDDLIQKSSPPRLTVDADENSFNILKDKFKTLTVSHLNKAMKLPGLKQNDVTSSVAVGGVLNMFGRQADDMNLLFQNNREKVRTPWVLSVVLLMVIAAIAGFWFIAPVYYEQQKLDTLDQSILAMKPDVKKVEAIKEEIEKLKEDITAIHQFKKQNDLTMDIVKDMTNILPARTWLTRLRITDTGAEIEGYSASATEIILNLENTKRFQKVEFASPTYRDPRMNTERFVIKMELKNSALKKELNKETNNEKE